MRSLSICRVTHRAVRRRSSLALPCTPILPRQFTTTSLAGDAVPDELVVETRENGVRVFSLARPKANALGRVLLSQLRAAIEDVAHDREARCVILRSTCPGIFCAGADLKERAEMNTSEVERFVSSLRSTFTMLSELPMPTIAVIDGAALGGGLELALCCDIRLAGSGEGSKVVVGLPETALAIIPGAGGTQRLPRVVGLPIAKRLIFTGERLDADAAAEIGLLEAIRGALPDPSSSLDTPAFAAALNIAETIARRGPVAVRMAKLAMDKGAGLSLRDGLAFEQACYAQTIPTKDRLEGLQAFKEKRSPTYTGE